MKTIFIVLCCIGTFVFQSCIEQKKSEHLDIVIELDSIVTTVDISTVYPLLNGNWSLLKIDRPWSKGPKYPKQKEDWDFTNGDTLIIRTTNYILFKFETEWNYVNSSFSNDSAWVMKRMADSNNISTLYEIQLSEDTLHLFEQCDDCESLTLIKKPINIPIMNRLEFSIDIKAERSKIWKALWDDKSYREWASIFFEGSYVIAKNWEEGSTVMFLAPDQSGIYSNIEKHIPNETILFKHIGNVVDGKEQPIDEETKKWSGATEVYTLTEGRDSTIKLTIEIDVLDEHREFMANTLPKALEKIKSLSMEN